MKDPLKSKDAQEPSIINLVLKIATTWWMYPVLFAGWAGNHPKIAAALSYLAGVTFYAEFGALFGYSFLATFGIFIAALAWWFATSQALCWYEEFVCESPIFYSRRSWFRQGMDFVDNEVISPVEEYLQKMPVERSIFFLVFMPCLGLPIYAVILAVTSVLLTVVLFLDWLRLLIVGFVNLCFTITPALTKEKIAWASVLWGTLGGMLAFSLYYEDPRLAIYFLVGTTIGGIGGLSLALWGGARKRRSRNDNPHFPP